MPRQALLWCPKDGKRGPGRPRKSWSDPLTEDLQNFEVTWTDRGEIAGDQSMWKSCVTNVFPEHLEGLRSEVRAFYYAPPCGRVA